ncbi:WXG100 family type VII secretion target [Mycobacterium sp. SMC-4]|uniref:WXG100 family type VII secretion target n=1 Tax=Mycobacterium sp. SMC-4 TaxID=2857059 RepID=UPI003D05410A
MGRSVEVVVSELHAAAARLRDAGQRLQDGLSSVDLETQQLLGSGWKGDAASAYATAWDQWHGGAGQVVRGLQTMSELLTIAGKEYAKTDEQSGQMLDSTMQVDGSGGGSGGAATPAGHNTSSPAATTQESALADQMGLEPSSPASGSATEQLPAQMAGGATQAGQMASGTAQQAVQVAGGLVQQAVQLAVESASGDEGSEPPDSPSGRADSTPPADEPPPAE